MPEKGCWPLSSISGADHCPGKMFKDNEKSLYMIEIIPAIDLMDGKCVRLSQGDYSSGVTYSENPLETALMFEDSGMKMLHLVDLDGARAKGPENLRVLEKIASRTSLKVEFGGGIKSAGILASVFDAGAYRAVCGSLACMFPEEFSSWLRMYGGKRIVLGADVRNGTVAVNGWLENTSVTVSGLVGKFLDAGLETVEVTDISRDGMMSGPASDIYVGLMREFPETVFVASGGIGSEADIRALDDAGVPAVIVGKAIYEGKIDLKRLAAGK